jgi:hypothetical protein
MQLNLRGQISLELLLLTAAFLAVLGLFLAVFQTVSEGGNLGLESLKAQSFADSFQQKTALLNVLGNGSESVLPASPGKPWRIRLHGNRFELFFSETGEKQKCFERGLSFSAVPTELLVTVPSSVVLQKNNGRLIVYLQEN